ncbi:LysR substrate-binding domain-containing protein [Alicyclobacillus fastidiosus]|uniref:LysR substrate-binding domain-containing protein n=1 Tax=Alicyclobacillus fastidiosus TaxID=392011 RepID=UPI0024E04AD2|nr:LysR substrate-binding domain-containing protein [Alicyclobacillus fastidiosus]
MTKKPPTPKDDKNLRLERIKESVLAGLGLTLLSKWAVHRELQWRTFVELKLQGMPAERTFSMILMKSIFRTNAASRFQNYPLEQVSKLSVML